MGQPITTYNTLVSAIAEISEDVGTELLEYIPVAVDNAENRLARELDFLGLVYTSTVVVSASTPTITKPTGHKITHDVAFVDPTTGRDIGLRNKSYSYLTEYWPQPTSVGTPVYYSDEDLNTFRIAPCASSQSTLKIRGVKRPPALSTSNQTNVFTEVAADALYYAAMLEIAVWQRNDILKASFQDLYISTRDNINNEGRRQKRDDQRPVNNPQGNNNLIQQ